MSDSFEMAVMAQIAAEKCIIHGKEKHAEGYKKGCRDTAIALITIFIGYLVLM